MKIYCGSNSRWMASKAGLLEGINGIPQEFMRVFLPSASHVFRDYYGEYEGYAVAYGSATNLEALL